MNGKSLPRGVGLGIGVVWGLTAATFMSQVTVARASDDAQELCATAHKGASTFSGIFERMSFTRSEDLLALLDRAAQKDAVAGAKLKTRLADIEARFFAPLARPSDSFQNRWFELAPARIDLRMDAGDVVYGPGHGPRRYRIPYPAVIMAKLTVSLESLGLTDGERKRLSSSLLQSQEIRYKLIKFSADASHAELVLDQGSPDGDLKADILLGVLREYAAQRARRLLDAPTTKTDPKLAARAPALESLLREIETHPGWNNTLDNAARFRDLFVGWSAAAEVFCQATGRGASGESPRL